ncbi:MAG: DNA recombination protein RmuC [Anaerolineales bacterium]
MTIVLLAVILFFLVALFAALLWVWERTNRRIDALNERLIEASQYQRGTSESFVQIQQNLGQLREAGRHMEQVGKEIAGLSDLLRAPKLRGGIGELFLGDLLAQMLSPEQYQLQYAFQSGERVDAVVKLAAGMVPVDSKFPLESFQRLLKEQDDEQRARERRDFIKTVRKHIDDIAAKYIRPDEGTFDFALMYIPAENVYYETIIADEAMGESGGVMSHALDRKVIPVSPNSFYAYLQAIALGLRGLQIEERAQEILGYLGRLEGDYRRFQEAFGVLGTHLENARKKYEETARLAAGVQAKLASARQPGPDFKSDTESLSGPGETGSS